MQPRVSVLTLQSTVKIVQSFPSEHDLYARPCIHKVSTSSAEHREWAKESVSADLTWPATGCNLQFAPSLSPLLHLVYE